MGEQRGAWVELSYLSALLLGTALTGCGGKSHADVPIALVFTAPDSSGLFGGGSRLKAHVQDGGSGARGLIDFYDTELDVNCMFVENSSGEYHCLPDQHADSYLDANCTELAFTGTDSTGAPPRAGMLVTGYSYNCAEMTAPYSLIEEQAVTQLYGWIGGKCYPDTVFPNSAWTVQPEPLTRFSGSNLSFVGDDGEAQALRATADDGAYVNLRTTAQGQPCAGVQLAQGQSCLQTPFAGLANDIYASDKCSGSELAVTQLTESDVCAGRTPTRAVVGQTKGCGREYSLRGLLDPVLAAFSAANSGQCDSYDPSIFGETMYRVGETVSSSGAPALSTLVVGSGPLTSSAIGNRVGTPLTQIFGDWHLADGERCETVRDTSGVQRCAPGLALFPDTLAYADANCTQQLGEGFECSTTPNYLLEETQADTGAVTLVAAYAAAPYAGPVYSKQPDQCQLLAMHSSNQYFRTGAAVDIDSFPVITETTDP